MKISKMIELLEMVKNNHGDVEVVAYNKIDEADGIVREVTFADDTANKYYYKGESVIHEPACVLECM